MKVFNFNELVNAEFTPRSNLCGKWLRTGEMVLCYARQGRGKSLFAMSVAYAAATGQSFLCWEPDRAFKVGYIEAEMPHYITTSRFRKLAESSKVEIDPGNLTIMVRDEQGDLPNLSTPQGQAIIRETMKDVDLLVIDNLTTIAPPTSSNDDDVHIWYRIKPFLYELRNANKCILLIHHSGKSGEQLGTSLRENDMDIIAKIEKPFCPLDKSKLSLELTFQKSGRDLDIDRNTFNPLYIEFWYETVVCWDYITLEESRKRRIWRLYNNFKTSARLIATALNLEVHYVQEVLNEKPLPLGVQDYEEEIF